MSNLDAGSWRLAHAGSGLKLERVVRRALGSSEFTWADLLVRDLARVQVFAIYFPSQFDLPVDTAATEALTAFGQRSGAGTSVNFWDPTDAEFSRALSFFGLESHPALVFATGLMVEGARAFGGDPNIYSITITDPAVLGNRERLAAATSVIHEIVARGNPDEIAGYVRGQDGRSLLEAIGRIAAAVRDEVLRLKPKVGLPGGFSVQLG
jgi:hypothetical protein